MKIENVGVGGFVRNPRGRDNPNSRGSNIEVLKVTTDNGNSFTCYPVSSVKVGATGREAVLDTTRYQQIPKGTNVQQVTI